MVCSAEVEEMGRIVGDSNEANDIRDGPTESVFSVHLEFALDVPDIVGLRHNLLSQTAL